MQRAVILFLLAFCSLARAHQRPRVYIALDDHTDYMWTADEETYRHTFVNTLDYYLDLADSTAGLPHEHQSRWNCDGTMWLWTYQHDKSSEEFARLTERMLDGHVSAPMNALCIVYGCMPAEAVLRSMYYAGKLERGYGLDFELAEANENQTLPYGLVSLWAGSGARYSWRGVCACATRIEDAGDREHEIYWWTGPDSSSVLLKWYSMPVSNEHLGGYAEARDPAAVVDYVTSQARTNGFRERYPYDVIGAFGKGWDDLETLTPAFVNVAVDKSGDDRLVIVSNRLDFFRDFESGYGHLLPRYAASFGNEWELLSASMAEVSSSVKRAVERLRGAEALAAMAAMAGRDLLEANRDQREKALLDMGLYWEHSWTEGPGVSAARRAKWQRKIAGEISSYVEALEKNAIYTASDLISNPEGRNRYFVFNQLSWTRSAAVDFSAGEQRKCRVVEVSSGREVPCQWVRQDTTTRLRIFAEDLPPLGYKVYEIRNIVIKQYPPAATVSDSSLENEAYRVTMRSDGAITSLLDKNSGIEYVASGDALNLLTPGEGTFRIENAGPVSVTLVAECNTYPRRRTSVTLYSGIQGVFVENRITQNFVDIQGWRYAFDIPRHTLWHEEVGAVIEAKLLTAGGHYAPRNARYDWLTLGHFALLGHGDGPSAVLSNADCFFMRYGASDIKHLDTSSPTLTVLAGGQIDGPEMGIPGQDGDSLFVQRFALTTGDGLSRAEAMRFALEHQNPPLTSRVLGAQSIFPQDSYSLASIDNPDVLVWALKPAEDGIARGVVARFWNLSARPEDFSLTLAGGPVVRAVKTSHIETDLSPASSAAGALHGALLPQQFGTYRLIP